jgi:hypothetical protein
VILSVRGHLLCPRDIGAEDPFGSKTAVLRTSEIYQKVIPVDLEKAVKAVGSAIAGGHLGF